MVILPHRRKAFRTVPTSEGGGIPSFINIAYSSATTIAVPTDTQENDLMVFYGGSFNPSTIAIPSGWTQVASTLLWQGSQYSTFCATKIASGAEPATYTFGTGTNRPGFIVTYRNATTTDVVGSITQFSGTSMTLTGFTSDPNSVLLACLQDRDYGVTHTVPTGMTQRLNVTSSVYWQMLLAELGRADSSNRVFTAASSTLEAAGLLISIK